MSIEVEFSFVVVVAAAVFVVMAVVLVILAIVSTLASCLGIDDDVDGDGKILSRSTLWTLLMMLVMLVGMEVI